MELHNLNKVIRLTTPGRCCSASRRGPSATLGVGGGDESDDDSGDEGNPSFVAPSFTVTTYREKKILKIMPLFMIKFLLVQVIFMILLKVF